MHPTITQSHITRIPAIPWSNRLTKWIQLRSVIKWLGRESDCSRCFDGGFVSLALVGPFFCFWAAPSFLYLVRSTFEARLCFVLVAETFCRTPRRTGQTGFQTDQTGLSRPGALFFSCPPLPEHWILQWVFRDLLCWSFLVRFWKLRSLFTNNYIFFLLSIRLDLAELTLWDYSIQACVYVQEKDSNPPSFVEQLFGLY